MAAATAEAAYLTELMSKIPSGFSSRDRPGKQDLTAWRQQRALRLNTLLPERLRFPADAQLFASCEGTSRTWWNQTRIECTPAGQDSKIRVSLQAWIEACNKSQGQGREQGKQDAYSMEPLACSQHAITTGLEAATAEDCLSTGNKGITYPAEEDGEIVFLGCKMEQLPQKSKVAMRGTIDQQRLMAMIRDTFARQLHGAQELSKTLPDHAKLPEGSLLIEAASKEQGDALISLPYDSDNFAKFGRKEVRLSVWIDRCSTRVKNV